MIASPSTTTTIPRSRMVPASSSACPCQPVAVTMPPTRMTPNDSASCWTVPNMPPESPAAAVTDVENQIAETKAKYPASQGTTFTFGQLTPQKQFGVVTSETDPSTKLVAQFGLQLDPAVKSLADQGPRTTVSGERVDLLDSDVLILWPLVGGAESFNSVPGCDQLPAVRNGTLVVLSNETASAFSSPTVYSVPWVVETMAPVLSKL